MELDLPGGSDIVVPLEVKLCVGAFTQKRLARFGDEGCETIDVEPTESGFVQVRQVSLRQDQNPQVIDTIEIAPGIFQALDGRSNNGLVLLRLVYTMRRCVLSTLKIIRKL